jgi:hypothetical protein
MAQNPAFAGEPASSAILAGPEASAALPATINTMLAGVSPEVVLDVVSLVDELVADAERDGAKFETLVLSRDSSRFWVQVSRVVPASRSEAELSADAAFGRLLVDEVATSWGTRGSTTWAEVRLAG